MDYATPFKKISDLTLSTYLRTRGHKLLSINRDGHRSLFVFSLTPALETDILGFYNAEARVEPLSFTELLRSLKAAAMGHGAVQTQLPKEADA